MPDEKPMPQLRARARAPRRARGCAHTWLFPEGELYGPLCSECAQPSLEGVPLRNGLDEILARHSPIDRGPVHLMGAGSFARGRRQGLSGSVFRVWLSGKRKARVRFGFVRPLTRRGAVGADGPRSLSSYAIGERLLTARRRLGEAASAVAG